MATQPLLTVFTATLYADVARLWHACVSRAFPADAARLEIFQDGDGKTFPRELFPGVTFLPRAPQRRDYMESYNDAVVRAATPYLALIDCDIFWLSPALWPWVRSELARPEVAAVSCVSRRGTRSHATFAVVLKADVYRGVLRRLPAGFLPCWEYPDAGAEGAARRYCDTGDLLTRAVTEAGYEVELLHLEERGDLARFDHITGYRRDLEYCDAGRLAEAMGNGERAVAEAAFFWRGLLGNRVLRRLHDRLFADGPRYDFAPHPAPALPRGRDGRLPDVVRHYLAHLRGEAKRIESFVRGWPSNWHGDAPRLAETDVTAPAPQQQVAAPPATALRPGQLVLAAGELYLRRHFGPDAVNRGAVLVDCEWDGGIFECGTMLRGVFRAGEFRGGTLDGATFRGGVWGGGVWNGGYDRQGRYRPRTDHPPHE